MSTCIRKTQELVALAKDGDGSALSQICRVYTERVRWMVRLRMGKELRTVYNRARQESTKFVPRHYSPVRTGR